MNYADMKRVFRRGGFINLPGQPTVVSLKEMLERWPIGNRRFLRTALKDAKSFVPRKHARGADAA